MSETKLVDSQGNRQLVQQATAEESGFFAGDDKPRPEIVEGLIREGQLVAFAGPYGVGKSPVLADIAVHVLNGIPWCGRTVKRRPIIQFDLETPGPTYRANVRNIAARLGVPVPKVPKELDVYLEHDNANEPATKKLLAALAQPNLKVRLDLIEAALTEKPDALVLIDPVELLFRIDTGKKQHVLCLYAELRRLLSQYPHAAILMTFNLSAYSDEGDHLFRFDPDQRFEVMPITIGAKRRWRMDLDRSDRHPSTNAMKARRGPREFEAVRNSRRRRGGNVGIRRLLPDFQARREGWETQGLSFPGFPPRVISTA